MRIKNIELYPVIEFLYNLPLAGKPSRMKLRLVEKLNERNQQYEKEKSRIAMNYAEKDENGNPKVLTENGQTVVIFDNVTSAQAHSEIHELMHEYAIIECNQENKDMLETVRDSVMNKIDNDEQEYSGFEAEIRAKTYMALESINYLKET